MPEPAAWRLNGRRLVVEARDRLLELTPGALVLSSFVTRSGSERCALATLAMPLCCERVHHQRVAEQVDVLADMADGVGASEPERVVELTVDALGVVATRVEPAEVIVVGRDRPEVLGPVQLARRVRVVAVQSHGDRSGAILAGQLALLR